LAVRRKALYPVEKIEIKEEYEDDINIVDEYQDLLDK